MTQQLITSSVEEFTRTFADVGEVLGHRAEHLDKASDVIIVSTVTISRVRVEQEVARCQLERLQRIHYRPCSLSQPGARGSPGKGHETFAVGPRPSSSSDAKRSAEASRRCDCSPERSVLR